MQVADRISALEKRAGALNLTLWRICRLASVDYSNISRWKRGQCSPTVKRLETQLAAVERKLGQLEREMLTLLTERVGVSISETRPAA